MSSPFVSTSPVSTPQITAPLTPPITEQVTTDQQTTTTNIQSVSMSQSATKVTSETTQESTSLSTKSAQTSEVATEPMSSSTPLDIQVPVVNAKYAAYATQCPSQYGKPDVCLISITVFLFLTRIQFSFTMAGGIDGRVGVCVASMFCTC